MDGYICLYIINVKRHVKHTWDYKTNSQKQRIKICQK